MTELTQHYLETWGGYVRRNRVEHLGYPRRNTIHRMMKEGPAASQSTAPVDYSPPPEVQIIDKIMPKLPQRFKTVLELRYAHRLSIRKGCKKMGLRKDAFASLLREATQRVAGCLDFITDD